MTPRAYSSVEAFVTHWRALRAAATRPPGDAHALSAPESALLRALDALLEPLDPAARAILEAGDAEPADGGLPALSHLRARRRQRALMQMTPLLAAAGWLS